MLTCVCKRSEPACCARATPACSPASTYSGAARCLRLGPIEKIVTSACARRPGAASQAFERMLYTPSGCPAVRGAAVACAPRAHGNSCGCTTPIHANARYSTKNHTIKEMQHTHAPAALELMMQAASESGGCTQSSRYQQQQQAPQDCSHPLADLCTVVHHTNGERLWETGTGLGARAAARCCWREMLSSAQQE
jgi:hypothetical protein